MFTDSTSVFHSEEDDIEEGCVLPTFSQRMGTACEAKTVILKRFDTLRAAVEALEQWERARQYVVSCCMLVAIATNSIAFRLKSITRRCYGGS